MVKTKKDTIDNATYILLLAFQDEVKEDTDNIMADLKELAINQATLKGELNGFATSFQGHMDGDTAKYAHLFEIKDMLTRNTCTLEANTADIKHHIARTDALEDRIEQISKPISLMDFIKKAGVTVTAISAILAIYKFFHH